MNKRIYLIAVRWKNNDVTKFEAMEKRLETIGTWLRFHAWTWLIKTEYYVTADMVYNTLNLEQDNIENVLITEINRNSKQGWAHKWIWDWINSN